MSRAVVPSTCTYVGSGGIRDSKNEAHQALPSMVAGISGSGVQWDGA